MHDNGHTSSELHQIQDLTIDVGARRVYRGDERLAVNGLTFDFLLALIHCAPSLASYDALADTVWQGRAVSAETIAQRAKMLRDALSDDAKNPRYFELIRGQGYRLLHASRSHAHRSAGPRRSRRWPMAAIAILLAVLAAAFIMSRVSPDEAVTPSVAILPFTDMSARGDQRYLADGIAEELLNQLARLDGLDVASRTESFFWQEPIDNLAEVGNALGVSAILEGSVRRIDDDLRVTVQLIDVESGFHIWSNSYDRRMQDLFATQEEIATSVAGALGVKLGVGDISAFPGGGTSNIDAYEALLRGNFEKAVELDPNYAAAWVRLGFRMASTMHERPPEEAPAIIDKALEYAAQAKQLEPNSAEFHTVYATLIYVTMDWHAAERAYARAKEISIDEFTVGNYANMQMRAGRSRNAAQLQTQRDAMMRVPTISWLRTNVSIALGQSDKARAEANAIREQHQAMVKLLVELSFGSTESVRAAITDIAKSSQDYRFLFGPLLEKFDRPDDAVALLERLAADSNANWPLKYHNIAIMAAYYDAPDLAFDVFRRELQYTPVRFGTLWHPLMSEVRKLDSFKQFVRDVNLEQYWRDYGWSDFCRPVGEHDFVCE